MKDIISDFDQKKILRQQKSIKLMKEMKNYYEELIQKLKEKHQKDIVIINKI